MKTVRQLLFERHRRAEPALDAVRQRVLSTLPASPTPQLRREAGSTQTRRFLRDVWLQLVWPSRRAWAGLAAVWLALLAANLGMKATLPGLPAAQPPHSPPLAQEIAEQRRLLAELLPPPSPPSVVPAPPRERPRSERSTLFKSC